MSKLLSLESTPLRNISIWMHENKAMTSQYMASFSDYACYVLQGAALQPFDVASKVLPETSSISSPVPTKVSSISTTNENKGVSVTRSHEVPGKSSTDGTAPSAAGKSGSLSLDALAKAKRALQMQKEMSEKLKKIPQVYSAMNFLNLMHLFFNLGGGDRRKWR